MASDVPPLAPHAVRHVAPRDRLLVGGAPAGGAQAAHGPFVELLRLVRRVRALHRGAAGASVAHGAGGGGVRTRVAVRVGSSGVAELARLRGMYVCMYTPYVWGGVAK